MKASDLLLVNHDGDVGDMPLNRAAFVLHSAVHKARPEVIAAAHPFDVRQGLLCAPPLRANHSRLLRALRHHHVISEQGGKVVLEREAGEEFASKFQTGKAAIHQNHGLFTVGTTVDEAAFWFITMERNCQGSSQRWLPETRLRFVTSTPATPSSRRAHTSPVGLAFNRCARNLRHRPRPLRLRLTSQVQPRRVPAEGLFIVSAISQYTALRSQFRSLTGYPTIVGWLRVVGATVALWLIARPRLGQWRGRKLMAPQYLASQPPLNTFFYLGIARIDLESVAIEFIGPIATLRSQLAPKCDRSRMPITGVLVLGGVEIGGEPAGVASSACWAAYIVVGCESQCRVAESTASCWPRYWLSRSRANRRPMERTCVGASLLLLVPESFQSDWLRHRSVCVAK